jgi:hypothetical protein
MKSFELEPVRYASYLLALLVAVETVNEAAHLLPGSWTPYLLGAIAVLSLLLGAKVRGVVTPLAAPKDAADTPLVPKSMAAGGKGMAGW